GRDRPLQAQLEDMLRAAWNQEADRNRLIDYSERDEAGSQFVLAVGLAATGSGETRALMPALRLYGAARLSEADEAGPFRELLEAHHHREPVYGFLGDALAACSSVDQTRRLLDLWPRVLFGTTGRSVSADRALAIRSLLEATQHVEPSPELTNAACKTLSVMTGGLSRKTLEAWRLWFAERESASPPEAPLIIDLEDILVPQVRELQARNEALVLQRREEVRRWIGQLRRLGEPAISYLLDSDSELRELTKAALKALAPRLNEAQRLAVVQELEGYLVDASQGSDIYRDLLDAAGTLGRPLPDEATRSLVDAVFRRDCSANPELLGRQVFIVGRIGAADEAPRLGAIYRSASRDHRDAGEAEWIILRRDTIRVLGSLRRGAEVVFSALADFDPSVRREAADVLKLMADRFGPDRDLSMVAFVGRLEDEPDASVRERLAESILAIVRSRPEVLTDELLSKLVAVPGETVTSRVRVRLGVAAAVLARRESPDELRERAAAIFAEGFESSESSRRCAEALLSIPSAKGDAMLLARYPASGWGLDLIERVATRLGDTQSSQVLWELVRRDATGRLPALLQIVDASLTAARREQRADFAEWRTQAVEFFSRSDRPRDLSRALALLEESRGTNEADWPLRLRRRELLHRIAVQDALSEEQVGLYDAELQELMNAPADTPGIGDRSVLRRERGRLALKRGLYARAIEIYAPLASDVESTIADRYALRLARLLESRTSADRLRSELEDLPESLDPVERADVDLFRAAASWLSAPEALDESEWLVRLATRSDMIAVELHGLYALRERERVTWKAWSQLDAVAVPPPGPEFSESSLQAIISLVCDAETDAPAARRLMEVLRAAEPACPVVWPAGTNGAGRRDVVAGLRAWWETRPISAEFAALFLKGI
ncbi:MAG: hypothetical protein KDB53_15415, partial [Planctomycetes bacterium]|nr:hypothetical protein [Planctomycetota bacterium]